MKRKKNNFFVKALIFFNILAIIALFLSYGASKIDPQTFWYLTLFGLAYPFIVLANVVFVVIWLLLKRWYFVCSLLLILLGYQPLTRTFGFRFAQTTDALADSNTIKLMTYNVHNFRTQEGILDTALSVNFFEMLRSENPDIVGFQEFFSRSKGRFNFKDSVLKILTSKSYYYNRTDFNDYESTGLAIFSKYPVKDSGYITFDSLAAGNKAVWVDVLKNEQVFRVYSVHLASISFQPEDYSFINDVKTDLNKKDVISSKRIVKKLKNAFVKRSSEIKELKEHIQTCSTPYLIMGDFNDTPASYALAQLTKGLKNAFQEKGSGLGKTYNGAFPNFQIDYILASNQFDFHSYKVIRKNLSDHYPVRANATLIK